MLNRAQKGGSSTCLHLTDRNGTTPCITASSAIRRSDSGGRKSARHGAGTGHIARCWRRACTSSRPAPTKRDQHRPLPASPLLPWHTALPALCSGHQCLQRISADRTQGSKGQWQMRNGKKVAAPPASSKRDNIRIKLVVRLHGLQQLSDNLHLGTARNWGPRPKEPRQKHLRPARAPGSV